MRSESLDRVRGSARRPGRGLGSARPPRARGSVHGRDPGGVRRSAPRLFDADPGRPRRQLAGAVDARAGRERSVAEAQRVGTHAKRHQARRPQVVQRNGGRDPARAATATRSRDRRIQWCTWTTSGSLALEQLGEGRCRPGGETLLCQWSKYRSSRWIRWTRTRVPASASRSSSVLTRKPSSQRIDPATTTTS